MRQLILVNDGPETGLVDELPHVRRGEHRFLTPASLDPLGMGAPGAAFRCETGEAAPPYHLLSPSSGRVLRCSLRFEHPAERYIGMLAPPPDAGSAGRAGIRSRRAAIVTRPTGAVAYAGIVTDPNWLLATMAQSAAALVAIVGGFLVSRVVTLASEREGLEQRARDLERQRQDQAERLGEAHHLRQDTCWEQFVDRAAYGVARNYQSLSPERLVDSYWVQGIPREEMLNLVSRLIEETQQAFEHFERGGDMPGPSVTDREVYKVYQAVNAARSPISRSPRFDSVEERLWKQERLDKLTENERELRADLVAVQREGELVRTELARVAKPPELWRAAVAFGYLAVFGVLAPVVGLAWRPVPSNLLWRILLVFGFVSGVGVLGWYLIWAVRQLSKPSNRQSVRDKYTPAGASQG